MKPELNQLRPYPFERLNALKSGIEPTINAPHIALSIGEPKHAPPDFVMAHLTDSNVLRSGLAGYPATRGSLALRESISSWLSGRFGVQTDPTLQVLPVAGTREALFSFAQAVMSGAPTACVLMPNPFYQIYEGAALLARSQPSFFPNQQAASFAAVTDEQWAATELLYVCSPANPSGHTIDQATYADLIERAHAFDFIIAADECYSEIYLDEEQPPLGLLAASDAAGNRDYARCVVFHSLSKRSNLPGLRSGFVAGDAEVLHSYYAYRTYEGCALPNHVQSASALAWADEQHVIDNRARYRAKFEAARRVLPQLAPAQDPAGGFYWWVDVHGDDEQFARELFRSQNVTVLPGSYLSRADPSGMVPGAGYVRIAWVAELEQCLAAANRINTFLADRP